MTEQKPCAFKVMRGVLAENKLSYLGYSGECDCGWTTGTRPKDDAWDKLADHLIEAVMPELEDLLAKQGPREPSGNEAALAVKVPIVPGRPQESQELPKRTPAAGMYPAVAQGYMIGSDPSCEIVVQDPYVSARHCKLYRYEDGTWKILDMGSTNGTWIVRQTPDGSFRIQAIGGTIVLLEGDKIEVGRTVIPFPPPGLLRP